MTTRWNDICRELTALSEEVYRWAVAQPSVGEESLTDWLLYTASERMPYVAYHKFTRHEEARESGADWDWWFVDGQHALGLRIQAKRLRVSKDLYPSLAHSNRHGLQIDKLRESASDSNLIPLYSFYSSESKPSSILCRGRAVRPSGQGIFLAAASSVHEMLFSGVRRQIAADQLVAIANPLPCVACCPIALKSGSASPVSGLLRHLEEYFPSEFDSSTGNRIGMHDHPPDYVASLLRGEREEMGDAWEQEFTQGVTGTKAILAFSLSD